MPMQKTHPNGLPHLNDAKKADGKVDQAAVLEGAQAWVTAIAAGQYQLTSVHEYALDDKTDVLVVHRKKSS